MGAGKSRDEDNQQEQQQQQQAQGDYYQQQPPCAYQSFLPSVQTTDFMQQRMPQPQYAHHAGNYSPMPMHQTPQSMMNSLGGPQSIHHQVTYGPKLGPMPMSTQMGYQANLPLKPFPGYPQNGLTSVPKFNQQQSQQFY